MMVGTASETRTPEQSGRGTFDSLVTDATDALEPAQSFMERLSEPDRRTLISKAGKEWHAAGSVICHEGDPGDALYIVTEGRIAVLKEISEGRSTLLGYRGPGEIVGEMSLVGQQPRSASVIAAEGTHLLRIEAADFPTLMDEHPGISWAILNVLSDRLQAADVARTTIIHEEQDLARRVERLSGEAARLAELARVRQETIELIVHDLRTPLAVIDGCLQMLPGLLSQASLDSGSDVLGLAGRATQRLMSLLEELLGAARQRVPDSVALAREPVDLVCVLQAAEDNALITARQSDISLRLQIPPELVEPPGDTAQLERVMGNLLDNAIAYTPAGGSIVVTAQERERQVEISVTDTGPGVPAEYRELIFERFTRVPGIEGRKQGFGLGLYFCRQVVQAHRGRIWVEPGPEGVGSRFVLTLPIAGTANGD